MNEHIAQGIATMRLLGHKWGAIAAVFSYSEGHLKNLAGEKDSDLYRFLTEGSKVESSDVAKAQLHHMMLNGMKGDTVKLAATKMVLDTESVVDDDTGSRDANQVKLEIIRELNRG